MPPCNVLVLREVIILLNLLLLHVCYEGDTILKKFIALILFLVLMIVLLSGCQQKNGSSLLKIDEGSAPTAVRNFISEISSQNGVNLYSDGVHGDYLFLNAENVVYGQKASYFTEVKCELVEETLFIYIAENQTEDYSKKICNRVIYKIDSSAEYDRIRIYRNGLETYFDTVGA